MLVFFERIISSPADLSLFLDRGDGYRQVIRDEGTMAWAIFRLQGRAYGGVFSAAVG